MPHYLDRARWRSEERLRGTHLNPPGSGSNDLLKSGLSDYFVRVPDNCPSTGHFGLS
jgi:hypothetical protein